jgi:quinol monooxygenase YgiN
MLVNLIRFTVKPDWIERWPSMVQEFTDATRAEDGNLWFYWARDLEQPHIFFLSEGFRDDAVAEHLQSPIIPKIVREWPEALVETPHMIMTTVPGTEWSLMERLPVPAA